MEKNNTFKISMVLFLSFVFLIGSSFIFSRGQFKKPVKQYKPIGSTRANIFKKTVTIKPRQAFYIPPHTRGDKDFKGHGPKVLCTVDIKPNKDKTRLVCTLTMHARETQLDFTTAKGERSFPVYNAPRGWTISRILTPTSSNKRYKDTNQDEDIFRMGNWGLVNTFAFIGDAKGNDAGTRTRVRVTFNNIKLVISRPVVQARPQVVTYSPGRRTYIPPKTTGDKDFAGNGPNIYCKVTLSLVENQRSIQCQIFMQAKETKHDYTTVIGRETIIIYRAPAGKKILKIAEGYISSKTYTDSDYSDDTFPGFSGPVGVFKFTGDTKGNEAGSRTKVVVAFRALHIHLVRAN